MDYYKSLFDGLASTQINMLYALAVLSEFEHIPVASTSQVQQCYQESLECPALSHRRVSGVLKELEVMNLIGGRNVSKGRGGRSSEVWLKVSARAVLDYDPGLKDAYSKIRQLILWFLAIGVYS